MKNYILLFFCFWTASGTVYGQAVEGKIFNKNGYQVWITTTENSVFHGLLWMVNEDTVYFTSDLEKNWKKPPEAPKILKLSITDIEAIRTKRVHAVWKGYGYGVLTGVAVGSVGALIYEAIEPDEGSALLIPLGGFLGSGIGIIAGLMPDKNFLINGNQTVWNSHLPDLDKRAFWRQPR